jgi:hypothetical protein
MRSKAMKHNAKTLPLVLFAASTLVASVLLVSGLMMPAQSPQSSSADKPPATATPGAAPSSVPAAKQDMSKPASASSPSASSASGSQASTTPTPSGAAKQQTSQAKSAGMVWVNTESGVYHKQGTRGYGKTKHGKYMLEADAIKAGYKPAK